MDHDSTNVLLVDNHPEDVERIKGLLRQAGGKPFVVHWVRGVANAIKCLQEENIDIVLMDIVLPDFQGVEAFEIISAHTPKVPVVVLSNQLGNAGSIEAVGEGAQDFLVKDEIELKILVRTIRYSIQRHFLQKDLQEYIDRLEEREKRFSDVIQTNPDALLVIDSAGTVQFFNEAATTLFNQKPKKFLGSQFDFPVEDGRSEQIQIKKGKSKPKTCELKAAKMPWGENSAYLAVVRDISHLK